MKPLPNSLLWKHSGYGLLVGIGIAIPQFISLLIKSNENSTIFLIFLYIAVFALVGYLTGKRKVALYTEVKIELAKQQERESLLSSFIEHKRVMDNCCIIVMVNSQGKITSINKRFEEITGFGEKSLLGKSVWRLPTSLRINNEVEKIKKTTANGEAWMGQIAYYKKGRHTAYANAIVVPLPGKSGEENGYYILQSDVTAEKCTELARLKIEDEKSIILENTQTLICIHDMNGRISSINRAGATMLGIEAGQVVGMSIHAFLGVKYRLEDYLKEINEKGFVEGHAKINCRDGKRRSLLFKNVVCKNEGGSYVIGSAIDISETIKAQKQVENQRTFIQQIINESPNMILVIDEEGQVLFLNRMMKSFFSISEDVTIRNTKEAKEFRKEFESIIPSEDIFLDANSTHSNFDFQMQQNSTTESRWFRVQRTFFTDKNTNKFILVICSDITEIHKNEIELIEAKKLLENTLQAKEQFFANMSHEIRTPLNSIIGFANLLEDTMLDESQQDSIQTIKIAGTNLLNIINDILDLSKMVTGNLQLSSVPIRLPEVVNNVTRLFGPKIREKNIYLHSFISDQLPMEVYGDEERLNQILINLVGNAVKFTNKGGVEIILKSVKGPESDKAYIYFAVRDTGIGIEKEKSDTIFKRYSQATNEIHKAFGGTGLGLNIVRNLVELFGGEIKVESELGQGSTFSFVLPLQISSASYTEPPMQSKAAKVKKYHRPLKILLAEDNMTNAKMATILLERMNFIVEHVTDGWDVLKKLENNNYDLILMDVQMLDLDGIETTKIIRSRTDLYYNIPIIALSAHSFIGKRDICQSAGMNGYVSKPFKPENLYEAIMDVMEEKNMGILQAV
ncbi:MAG: PAS domain S-box protein [Chitinophagaceae bacterium]|nr:PAS domain S-box protein [Chitinophagaceae bacterium]